MEAKTVAMVVGMLVCVPFVLNTVYAEVPMPSEKETHECGQALAELKAVIDGLKPGPTNDLVEYEKSIDAIERKWSQRNRECYARLILTACGPLGSGSFKDTRRYELARKYALSVLDNPDTIPLMLELELVGHVVTPMMGPNVPRGEAFSQQRNTDTEVRLHAWRRVLTAVDSAWNPNDMPVVNVTPPAATGFPSGIAPDAIKDAALRAQYEADIQRNRQRAEKYTEQHRLQAWLRTFPQTTEHYIVEIYSHPPYNVGELRKLLDEHKMNENVTARILNAVTKNCDKEATEKGSGRILGSGVIILDKDGER